MPFITPADVENLLNVDFTENGDTLVTSLIAGLSAYLQTACNRVWGSPDEWITEEFDGGVSRIFPKNTPIKEIQSLTVGLSPLVADQDFWKYETYVRLGFVAAHGPRSIVLSYKVDNPFPADLKTALTRWVADVFVQRPDAKNYGVSRLTQGPVTIEYDRTRATQADPTGHVMPGYVMEAVRLHRLPNV